MREEELSRVWDAPEGTPQNPATPLWKTLLAAMQKALRSVRVHKRPRALQLAEMLPLGEKRFLAVVQWEGERILLGVTAQSITLLEPKELPARQDAGDPGTAAR